MIRAVIASGFVVLGLCACTGEFPAHVEKLTTAEDTWDAELLVSSLNEIEFWHLKNKTGVAGILEPGRSASEIVSEFSGTPCKPTEELKTLWSWRDGGVGPVPFVWYHDFLSMEEARSEYRWLILNPMVRWDPRYVPVLSFQGEWYAVYCGKGARSSGPLVHFLVEDGPRITHVNLTMFMAGMAEALRTGAVRWENGAMVEDIRKMQRIHRKYNAGYEFPYYVADGD